MPRCGFQSNGVPIPIPPKDVLEMKDDKDGRQYLVLFFDAKRTWWVMCNYFQHQALTEISSP